MGRQCCVPLCHCNSSTKKTKLKAKNGCKITFHCLPTNKDLKAKWIQKIRRDPGKNFHIQPYTSVCSLHFAPEDFKRTLTGKTVLQKNAVPSIFNWSQTVKTRRNNRKEISPKKMYKVSEVVNQPTLLTPAPHFDHVYSTCNITTATTQMNVNAENGWHEPSCEESLPKESTNEEIETMYTEKCIGETSEENRLDNLKKQLSELRERVKSQDLIISKLIPLKFCLQNILCQDKLVRFYTGFKTGEYISAFVKQISLARKRIKFEDELIIGILDDDEQLFLCLVYLRLGLFVTDLANRYNIPVASVTRIITIWINKLNVLLGSISIWPDRNLVNKTMPGSFKDLYPATRVILDCIDIFIQHRSSLILQSQVNSHYKGLVGISPSGGVSFISILFTGNISDKEITIRSGITELLEEGDEVMANKGFLIEDDLAKVGVSLNIPPFLGGDPQVSAIDANETKKIDRLRVHVERSIRRVREFHIFDKPIPLTMSGSVNQIWTVCCLLINFQDCLNSDK